MKESTTCTQHIWIYVLLDLKKYSNSNSLCVKVNVLGSQGGTNHSTKGHLHLHIKILSVAHM